MKPAKLIPWILPAAVLLCGTAALAIWQFRSPAQTFKIRGPSAYKPERSPGQGPSLKNCQVTPGPGTAADDSWGSWPAFRGPNLNLVSDENIPLASSWPEAGPPVLWRITVGDGYAAPAALGGRLFLLDYDHERGGDALRCLSLADGREIWRNFYPIPTRGDHGVTRSTPAVTEKYVVSISPQCYVLCADTDTGNYRWGMDLVSQYGTQIPDWYAAQCPIIDNGRAIIAPGGDKIMIAVDCETGKTVWEAPNPRRWKMTHSVITPIEFAGKRMYVYPASGGVVGVSAEDGAVLWEHVGWVVPTANVPAPVLVGDDGRIFLSGGYGAGSRMIQLVEGADGKIDVKVLYDLSQKVFSTYQQTAIFYEGFLYGVLTKEAGATREQLACLSPEGKIVWTSGKANRYGWGPWVIADKKLFVMDDTGELTMASASPGGFAPLGKAKVFDAHESWGPLTIIGGRLLCRDLKELLCVDLRAK